MGGVSRWEARRNNQGLGLTRSPPTKRSNSMLMDKVRELDKKLTHATAGDSSEAYRMARNKLIDLIPQMAQALIAVDDVLKVNSVTNPKGNRDIELVHHGYTAACQEIRKAIESTSTGEAK